MDTQPPREELYGIGVQSFSELRRGNYVYVDKTKYIAELTRRGKYYFLARPRRFGKSLLMSTLEAYFQGRRDLFEGLAVDRLVRDWTPVPVIHLDLSAKKFTETEELETMLHSFLKEYEEKYDLSPEVADVDLRFGRLLKRIYEKTGRRSAVLIDEYDKPLLNITDNEKLCEYYRAVLKGFYGNLKRCDPYIHFAMLTGVSRFAKVSIFSDLNNLDDISMDDRYADICGITEQELEDNFPQGLNALSAACVLSRKETLDRLREWYDGYHFTAGGPGLYNPFSLLKVFSRRKFGAYWYSTATTTQLAQRVKKDLWNLPELHHAIADGATLADIEAHRDPVPLLFQTGYLTIKGYDPEIDEYTLDYPNREVRRGFENSLCKVYAEEGLRSDFDVARFRRDIALSDTERFMQRLTTLFANFPYERQPKGEYWFQSIVYTIFMVVGQLIKVEDHTARGRSDMTVFTREKLYVFEFKYGDSHTPEEAISQIRAKGYAEPYALDSREKILIGAVYHPSSSSLVWRQESL